MSIRTLIEVNHDYLHEIEDDSEEFVTELLKALRDGLNPFSDDSGSFFRGRSFTIKWSRHHSDECPVDKAQAIQHKQYTDSKK